MKSGCAGGERDKLESETCSLYSTLALPQILGGHLYPSTFCLIEMVYGQPRAIPPFCWRPTACAGSMNARWLGCLRARRVQRKCRILLPRALEVFKLLPGTAPLKFCFLTKTVGLIKDINDVQVFLESLDEIGIAILKQNKVDWEDFCTIVKA